MEKYQQNPYKTTNRYAKLKEGNNTFRLFNYINGWEYWIDDNGKRTPQRKRDIKEVPEKYQPEAKYFRAFVVWDYEDEVTKILSLTQRTILEPLTELFWDTDWGDHSEYDIVISRKGEGLETEYGVRPKPKKEFDKTLDNVNLELLYVNGDPFDETHISNEELDEIGREIAQDLDD